MPATAPAERKRAARENGRRRDAVAMLRLGEQTCSYAAAQLGNGLTPGQARRAALETAGLLESTAAALRRLTRLTIPERRALARQLHGWGLPTRAIAAQLGVCERTARYYIAGRRYSRVAE